MNSGNKQLSSVLVVQIQFYFSSVERTGVAALEKSLLNIMVLPAEMKPVNQVFRSFSGGNGYTLAITMEDAGTNLSTVKYYKNGSLFTTSASNKTAPDAVSRSVQYIGRSGNSTPAYFTGDLDEVRLYRIALSAGEINSVYSGAGSTTWYTISGNNNPTSFSATGLPTGLSVNPDTGEISGHTTAVGDHNITVTASNLSGSDSKVVTLTVGPTKPLLESAYTVTRQSDLLGWLKFDETTGTTSSNYGSEGSASSLKSGATFSVTEKKFGASSLNIPAGSTGAYAELTTPIDLGPTDASDSYSIVTWFSKKLYPATTWRTLTRGSSANHQVIVKDNSDELGTHSGWVGSGYNLSPTASSTTWQHLVATFDGSRTKFYIDGSYVGQLDASEGNNIYAIGNYQGGSQALLRIPR